MDWNKIAKIINTSESYKGYLFISSLRDPLPLLEPAELAEEEGGES